MCSAYSLITQIMSFSISGLQGDSPLPFFDAAPRSEKKQIFSKVFINNYITLFCHGIITDAQ